MNMKENIFHKKDILTIFGSFEWKFLCFGLGNALTVYTRMILHLKQDSYGK